MSSPHLISDESWLYSELLEAKVSTDEGGTGAKCLTENKEELDHATRFLHDNGKLHTENNGKQTNGQTD